MNSKIEIHSNDLETGVTVDGKEISGNIVHLAMEIKPLEVPKVTITLAAAEVSVEGVADIMRETDQFVPHDIDGVRGWSLSSPTGPGVANQR